MSLGPSLAFKHDHDQDGSLIHRLLHPTFENQALKIESQVIRRGYNQIVALSKVFAVYVDKTLL